MTQLKSCHCCGLVQMIPASTPSACARCASALESWRSRAGGNELSAALAMAALALYVPSMLLPFLRIERLGQSYASSLIGGVGTLFTKGHLLVGTIVLAFSIVLPVLKLSALLVLSQQRWQLAHHNRAVVYRMVEHLGRWGMLDVLLVAVMVAFVKLGGLVQFSAGTGLVLFSAFVLLSLCASAAFDPYALWDEGVGLALSTDAGNAAAAPQERPPGTVSLADVPSAQPLPPRSPRWWVWAIPLLAAIVAGGLIWNIYAERGRVIVLTFREGHGVSAGAELRYHGITCGTVETARLSDDLSEVQLEIRLTPEADGLAREGARFWIVRPQVDLTGIAGLETVVRAKYITLLPGEADGPRVTRFAGLDEPPIPDLEEPGGIEIVLQSPQGAGLRRGLGVHYRDIRVGGIVSTGLAGDGSAIETRVYIRPAYRHLARERARFWNASGVHVRGGLTEIFVHIGSAETLLRGGVSMSLPPEPGELVTPGHRFVLHESPQKEWLQWQPSVTIQSPSIPLPELEPAVLRWTHDGLFLNRPRERYGWLLPTEAGLSGPRDLLTLPDGALNQTATLTLADVEVDLSAVPPAAGGDGPLTIFPSPAPRTPPALTTRRAEIPEDLYLATGEGVGPLFVAAVRLETAGERWRIDSSLPITAHLHGAAAIATSDGALLGRLICEGDDRWIVLVTGP